MHRYHTRKVGTPIHCNKSHTYYVVGNTLLKELIQNAEDAKAIPYKVSAEEYPDLPVQDPAPRAGMRDRSHLGPKAQKAKVLSSNAFQRDGHEHPHFSTA